MEKQYLIIHPNIRPHVSLVQLNRPKALNAICLGLMQELVETLKALDADPDCRCIVVSGNARAFAAGADITEMAERSAVEMMEVDQYAMWESVKRTQTPMVAAVSGFALGGGCELAMHCDMIVASTSAKFGQPEINLGVMPGAGGTQRLTRAVGKALAMEMVLTGRLITAREAQQAGLINRVVPVELYLDEALNMAAKVASKAPLAARLAKEAVLYSFNASLDQGLHFERKNYYTLYATQDQKAGMKAFLEKQKPDWQGK